ncbi:hypothetical protein JCM11251_007984 [Rhodosporidiobolus azoricus]
MDPPDDLSDSEYISPAPVAPPETSSAPSPALKQSTLTFNQIPPSVYLSELNPAQRDAVTWQREGGLAVHAGPGSGKTKVLTTRVAYLIQEAGVKPEELVVVTFTNKAANEMKVRLAKIVGAETVDKVVLGTFHSVCVRYLRKYAKLVGLVSNFLITDRDDCLAIIKRLLMSLPSIPSHLKKDMKPPTWLEAISRCKAKMMTPDMYRASKHSGGVTLSPMEDEKVEAVAEMYEAYEAELAKSNALDFDDLLVRGYQLFRDHPRVVGKIRSVLIDEFQDTNTVQYDLVKLVARASGSLTIVGDPDQSIYGWRNAEIENLEKMLEDFKPVKQIFLEQNYRSTGAILGAALAVVRQDTKRINKSLYASHPSGTSVVLHHAPTAQDEAAFIASSIKHLVAHLGGLVTYNDCAVLLRYGALSRAVETALQRAGVPSRMVGGHKFFERAEIKDLLSYLQLIHSPTYSPALLRTINTPRRGLGDKTIREIEAAGERKGISAFEVCVKLANGAEGLGLVKGLTGAQRKQVKSLIQCVRDARRMADEGADVAELIDFVCEKIKYKEYLERTHTVDHLERWENVEELKSFATIVAKEGPGADLATALEEAEEARESQLEEVNIDETLANGAVAKQEDEERDDEIESVEDDREEEKIEVPLSSQAVDLGIETPLSVFLATSMLATDADTSDAKSDAQQAKVTISTCHAAKGLEWPIVFVPACEDGTYPFFRASEQDEVDEERRLLYVAITRAQGFCFLSHANQRMAGADMKQKELSPFLSTVSTTYPSLFVKKLQKITKKTREEIASVLGRAAVDEEVVKGLLEEYNATQPVDPVIYDPAQHGGQSSSRNYSSFGRYGGGDGFSSGPFASQGGGGGRYGTSSGFTSGAGQSLGKWSNPPSASAPQPQPVPPGQGGFRSALSTFRPAGSSGVNTTSSSFSRPSASGLPSSSAPQPRTTTGLPPPPPRTASASTVSSSRTSAFRPPAMMNPHVPSSSSTSSSSIPAPLSRAPPLAPIPSTAPTDDGRPPLTTETRSSVINEGVLVNPKLSAPRTGMSKSGDLLAAFQSGANAELDVLKQLGKTEEITLPSSDDLPDPSTVKAGGAAPLPPQSPKYARGKRAAPLRRTAGAAAKKAKK